MSTVKDLAERTAVHYADLNPSDENAAFNPAFIMVIAEMIRKLVEAFQDCKLNANRASAKARRPGLWDRRVIRIHARRELGRKEYRRNGGKVVDALLETGKDITEQDVKNAYRETI